MTRSKSVSMWWYSVPLLFALVGGIIGYYAVIDKDKKTAKNLLIVGIVISVIAAVFNLSVMNIMANMIGV